MKSILRITTALSFCLFLAASPARAELWYPDGTTTVDGGPNGNPGQYSPEGFLLDNGSIPNGSGRTVSGGGIAGGWTVFQPFTVPAPGWNVTTIGTDGWNVQDPQGRGMRGTLLPDQAGQPNEGSPISTAVYFLGTDPFNSNWRDQPHNVALGAGRYWMKWEDVGDPLHWSAIFLGLQGEASFSRNDAGNIFPAGATALRIDGSVIPEPMTLALFALGLGALGRRRAR